MIKLIQEAFNLTFFPLREELKFIIHDIFPSY